MIGGLLYHSNIVIRCFAFYQPCFRNHNKWFRPVLNHQNCASSTSQMSPFFFFCGRDFSMYHHRGTARVFLSLESEIGLSDAWRVKGIWGDFFSCSWFRPQARNVTCAMLLLLLLPLVAQVQLHSPRCLLTNRKQNLANQLSWKTNN